MRFDSLFDLKDGGWLTSMHKVYWCDVVVFQVEAEKADEAVVPEGPRGDQPEEKDDDGDKKDGKDDTAAEATETGVSIRARFSKVSNRGVISLFLVPVSGF